MNSLKKLILSIILALLTFFEQTTPLKHQDWLDHKATYGKVYINPNEDSLRKAIFEQNFEFINEHNKKADAGLVSYRQSLNQFSDLTYAEFVEKYMGYNPLMTLNHLNKNNMNQTILNENEWSDPPKEKDWRKIKGRVGPIKNQGQCGSCWSFSAVGAFESAYHASTGKSIILSEQQLVDCSKECSGNVCNNGCNGGVINFAYDYIIKIGGLELSKTYPYISGNRGMANACQFKKKLVVAKMSRYETSPNFGQARGNEKWLENIVGNIGPVAVALYASQNFMNYQKGIFNDFLCDQSNRANHAVIVVGYGSQDGKKYWIVRNSWGAGWGEQGYIRLRKNANNMCAISSWALYPIV